MFTKLCTHRHYQFQNVLTIPEGNLISTSSYSPSPAPQPREPLECFGFRFGGSQVPSAGGWAAAGMLRWPRPAEARLGGTPRQDAYHVPGAGKTAETPRGRGAPRLPAQP